MSFNISLLRTVIAFSTELRGYSATILGRSADDTLPHHTTTSCRQQSSPSHTLARRKQLSYGLIPLDGVFLLTVVDGLLGVATSLDKRGQLLCLLGIILIVAHTAFQLGNRSSGERDKKERDKTYE